MDRPTVAGEPAGQETDASPTLRFAAHESTTWRAAAPPIVVTLKSFALAETSPVLLVSCSLTMAVSPLRKPMLQSKLLPFLMATPLGQLTDVDG